jgi:hypothetical protein
MKPEYLITLPNRGIQVIAPGETAMNMELARSLPKGGAETPRIQWTEREKTRLWLMKNCRILANRLPSKESGKQFMETVDYKRREELLAMAHELSDHIAQTWTQINPDKKIAVILYGSVAKGLVKTPGQSPASDIDLTAIGDFSDSERAQLRARIHSKREEVRDRIVSTAFVTEGELDIRYAGALVQNVSTLTKNGFSDAINYVKSGASAIYDPSGIWAGIEGQALDYATNQRLGIKPITERIIQPLAIIFEDEDDPRSSAAFSMMAERGIPLDTGIKAPIGRVDMQAGKAYFPRKNSNNGS